MPPSDPGRTKGQRGGDPGVFWLCTGLAMKDTENQKEEGLGWEEARENSREAKNKG